MPMRIIGFGDMADNGGYAEGRRTQMNIFNLEGCPGAVIGDTNIVHHSPVPCFTLERLKGHSAIFEGAWREEDDVFYETVAYRQCESILDNHPLVVIVGNSGDGKSAIGKHLGLRYAQNGYLVLKTTEAAEIERCFNPELSMVFLCDDSFGRLSCNHDAVVKFIQHEENLRQLLQNRCGKVIITCRKQVWNECRTTLVCSELFREVDISSDELKPTKEERLEILHSHLRRHAINLSATACDKIASEGNTLGYPLCCKMYSSFPSPSDRNVDFIQRPLKFLLGELDSQHKEDDLVFLVLVLVSCFANALPASCLLSRGRTGKARLKMHEILTAFRKELSPSLLEELKTRADRLLGVFLKLDPSGEFYKFIHHSVFEAVVIKFGNQCPEVLLRWCPNDLIRERFRSKNADGNIEHIYVKGHWYRMLARSFLVDLMDGYGKSVFQNPSLKDEGFEQAMVAEIKSQKCARLLAARRSLEGFCTIYYAAGTGCRHLVEILFMHHKIFAQDDETHHPVVIAAAKGHLPVVRILMKKDVPSAIMWAAIGEAAYGDHVPVVKHIMASRHKCLTPDVYGMAAVTAVIKNNISVLEFLCSDQARVNLRFTVPRQLAGRISRGSRFPSVLYRLLLESKFMRNHDVEDLSDFTLLHFAIAAGNHASFQFLMNNRINVNTKSGPDRDMTPLHLAVKCGQTDMAKRLLQEGATVNDVNEKMRTALHYAVRFGKTHLVDVLLTFGAEASVKDTKGFTPLDYANRRGNPRIIQKLNLEREVESGSPNYASVAMVAGIVSRPSLSPLEYMYF